MSHATRANVLLVEPDASLRRLIVLGLEHRGLQVTAVSSLTALAGQSVTHPDLLVLDIDNGYHDDAGLLGAVQAHAYLSTLPVVVLTWEKHVRPVRDRSALPLLEYLPKPFDARRLHATIENLLVTSAAVEMAARRGVVSASPATVISLSSLCPLCTAVGLLLIFVGLLFQPVIAGAGMLVMLAGLLWWTLGTRPAPRIILGQIPQSYSPTGP